MKPVYTKLEKLFKANWHTDYLHSHNRQQLLKQLARDWKSYFNSIKDYNINPKKYQGQPRPPKFKYLNRNPSEVIFTNLATRIRKGNLLLFLSKEIKSKYNVKSLKFELPSAVQSIIDLDNIQQVKIKRDKLSDNWYLLVIYKVEPKNKAKGNNIMAIASPRWGDTGSTMRNLENEPVDLGLNNLATLTFKDNTDNYIINGRPIKSKNSYFNKKISKLQSIRMKQTGSKKFRNTKKIKQLRIKRKNYITNYLHKASRKIINLAKKHKISKLIIGDIKQIKQNMKYNKSFVQIPIQRLKELIEYKAKLEGIELITVNEAYTSGCTKAYNLNYAL